MSLSLRGNGLHFVQSIQTEVTEPNSAVGYANRFQPEGNVSLVADNPPTGAQALEVVSDKAVYQQLRCTYNAPEGAHAA